MDSKHIKCSLCSFLNLPENLNCSNCGMELLLVPLEPAIYVIVRSEREGECEVVKVVDKTALIGDLSSFDGCYVLKTYRSLLIAEKTIYPLEVYIVTFPEKANNYISELIKIYERRSFKITAIPVL